MQEFLKLDEPGIEASIEVNLDSVGHSAPPLTLIFERGSRG